jgi:hypothetical protein
MLFCVRHTFADLRFVLGEESTGKLGLPNWPAPIPDYDFIRNVGSVRARRRGGVPGWIGEGSFCHASKALRIEDGKKLQVDSLKIKVVYRRFYSSGMVSNTFDIGFGIADGPRNFQLQDPIFMRETYQGLLTFPVTVPDGEGGLIKTSIIQAGKHLAKLLLKSTSNSSQKSSVQEWWIQVGRPTVFVEHAHGSNAANPFNCRVFPASENRHIFLAAILDNLGRGFPIWIAPVPSKSRLKKDPAERSESDQKIIDELKEARHLRVGILRLHSEHECLRLVLREISSGRLILPPRSKQSDLLQHYLNETIRFLNIKESDIGSCSSNEAALAARAIVEAANPGEMNAVIASLRVLDIRKNILRKVQGDLSKSKRTIEKHYHNHTHMDTFNLHGDNYGHFGNVYNQWQGINNASLDKLAASLADLRVEMKNHAKAPEHDAAIGAIAEAETAAKKGNGPAVFQALARAGKWALDVAKEFSIQLAAEALVKVVKP